MQFAAVRDPAAPVNPAVPYLGRTLPVTNPGVFHAADWFTPQALSLIDLAGRVCIEQMAAALAGLTMADVFTEPATAMDEFTTLFSPHEIPIQRYPRPVRLAHGTADQLPAALTEITAGQLAAAGTDVTYTPLPGADHFTVLALVAPQVVDWLGDLFMDSWRSRCPHPLFQDREWHDLVDCARFSRSDAERSDIFAPGGEG